MKKSILFFVVYAGFLFITSCSDNGAETKKTSKTFKRVTDTASLSRPPYWRIDKDIAEEMIRHAECSPPDCQQREPRHIDWNLPVYRDILNNSLDPAGVTWVLARYREVDQERYSRKRNIPYDESENGKPGKVKDYLTYIVKVVDPGNLDEEPIYYDIASICPPPNNCPADQILVDTSKN